MFGPNLTKSRRKFQFYSVTVQIYAINCLEKVVLANRCSSQGLISGSHHDGHSIAQFSYGDLLKITINLKEMLKGNNTIDDAIQPGHT